MLALMVMAAALATDAPTAAPTAPAATTATSVQTAAATPRDPMVCRTVKETGTMFSKRVCLTASQWSDIAKDARDTYDALREKGWLASSH
jgi:hypothetical protein